MERKVITWIPVAGVILAVMMLAVATVRYTGDVHWSRVTVSLLCAQNLPDGATNPGRGLPIFALVLLCASMSLLFELISRTADNQSLRKTIQIGGIGSMVYALLTATPMHNLMVNIALAFFLVASIAIVWMLFRNRQLMLASIGVACLFLKLLSVTMYYTDSFVEIWGILQKLSFLLTTIWLFAVLLANQHPGNNAVTEFTET